MSLKPARPRATLSPNINRKGTAMTDRCTKIVLSIIATCLVWNVLVDSAPPVEARFSVPSRPAAENPIQFPAVDNNVSIEQVQALSFRPEDFQLPYGADPLQYGKLYLPNNANAPYPLIVFIHGGCWRSSIDMSLTYPLLTALAQSGFAVWSLEYRRTGDTGGGWPGTYEDIKAGIESVATLTDYSVDTDNFILVGHSAGGHLALLAGTETPKAKGVIGMAPITNIISYSQGAEHPTPVRGATGFCQSSAVEFMGSVYNQNPLAYRQANPADKNPHPNSLILQGTLDSIVPIEQSRLTGARTELEENAGHFDWVHPGSKGYLRLVESAASMLAQ